MSKIALISCTSSKKDYVCEAKELYSKSLAFRLEYEIAGKIAEKVYILSAKHGLVSPDTVLAPYNYTLINKPQNIKVQWSNNVLKQMKQQVSLENDEFIIFTGKDYYEYLLPSIKNYWLPLKGMRQGERIPVLRNLLAFENGTNLCMAVHELFNKMPRMNYKMIDEIPFNNGIYVMFENGQKYGKLDRIVRIGTHTSDNRLKDRLKNHFNNPNKDGSIFRKNIGKALLNKNHDPYLDIWTLDASNKINSNKVDKEKQKQIESNVSDYLRENISFTCFPVSKKEDRLRLEEAIISLLNNSDDFFPDSSWLGKFSPVDKICKSGLWLSQGLDAKLLTAEEFAAIKDIIRFGRHSYNIAPNKYKDDRMNNAAASNVKKVHTANISVSAIRKYICNLLQEKKLMGEATYTLRAGDLAKKLGIVNAIPSVCDAMTKKINYRYEILFEPPKGKSTKVTVKYYLNTDAFCGIDKEKPVKYLSKEKYI